MAVSQTGCNQQDVFLPEANASLAEAAFHRKAQTHHQFLLAIWSGKQWEELLSMGARESCSLSWCVCVFCHGNLHALLHVTSVSSGPCLPSRLPEECSARQHLSTVILGLPPVFGITGKDIAVIFGKQGNNSAALHGV